LCGPDSGAFYAYAFLIRKYTQYMYNKELYTYIKAGPYVNPHWKPLNPLCSRPGYGPDQV